MSKSVKNILVSGASGIIGYGILRSLSQSIIGSVESLNLIGTTIYTDSPAEYFCNIFEKASPTADKDYIKWLLTIIKKHNIDLIIPGIEDDMYKWQDNLEEIKSSGVSILLNNISLVKLCEDKWKFYEFLEKNKSPYRIESSLESDFDYFSKKFGLPFILKPRRGHGSKGIVRVSDKKMFLKHKTQIGNTLMVQPLIGQDDEEYTVSAFADGKGSYYNYITLKRKLSKDGYTEKAEVVDLDLVVPALTHLCGFLKPEGPTNFQFRLHRGKLKLLEINPRISSSTSIRTKFGYNESLMSVNYYLNNINPIQPGIRRGKAVRYIEDVISYE